MDEHSKELPVLGFADAEAFEAWLSEHHASSPGIWLLIGKKGSDEASVTYGEALEVALCFGWIDSRKEKRDASHWLQRFTPRGPRSIWSKVNKEKAERLIAEGRMQPAGLRSIEAAKRGGEWDKAYASQSNAEVPGDFAEALARNPKAQAFFDALDRQNRYAMTFRIHGAKKPETRAKRIAQFVEMLEKGEKIYN
ncbi:YdeI/OmpD-associated family protein [Paenibacillus sp. GCM10023250]|uniref:YdeI/OmpD-associated family protein n=1 Tax=Paenibacillus sp. GCM10023250 TaxID=3252648 RepID=UPI0036145729